jgi:phospholipid/cholesterol/gamma-HCH transport system substrate-binding protein
MNIEQKARQYIHKDAAASISSDGLIGNRIVVITSGTPSFPFIEDGDRIKVNTTLSTDEIMKTFQVNNKNLVDITSDFKKLSADLVAGKGAAGALLSDEQIADNFRAMVLNLRNTAQATTRMAAELNTFTATLNTKDGLANKMFTDTVIFSRLMASVNELEKTAKSASALSENLNTASANVSTATSKLNQKDNLAGVLINDAQTAEQLKKVIANLESSSYNLNEDLKSLQGNILFRGYFKKKAKEEANK